MRLFVGVVVGRRVIFCAYLSDQSGRQQFMRVFLTYTYGYFVLGIFGRQNIVLFI